MHVNEISEGLDIALFPRPSNLLVILDHRVPPCLLRYDTTWSVAVPDDRVLVDERLEVFEGDLCGCENRRNTVLKLRTGSRDNVSIFVEGFGQQFQRFTETLSFTFDLSEFSRCTPATGGESSAHTPCDLRQEQDIANGRYSSHVGFGEVLVLSLYLAVSDDLNCCPWPETAECWCVLSCSGVRTGLEYTRRDQQ